MTPLFPPLFSYILIVLSFVIYSSVQLIKLKENIRAFKKDFFCFWDMAAHQNNHSLFSKCRVVLSSWGETEQPAKYNFLIHFWYVYSLIQRQDHLDYGSIFDYNVVLNIIKKNLCDKTPFIFLFNGFFIFFNNLSSNYSWFSPILFYPNIFYNRNLSFGPTFPHPFLLLNANTIYHYNFFFNSASFFLELLHTAISL